MQTKRPITILFLQSSAQIGGTELINYHHWQRLSDCFRATICFLGGEGPVSELYRRSGGRPVHLDADQRPLSTVWRDLRALITRQRFDIIHIFGLRANLLGRLAARIYTPARVITGQHSVDAWRRRWHIWADRLTSRWVDLYISNSLAGARRLQQVEGILAHKIVTIHNGFDVQPFAAASAGQIRPALGIDPAELVAVFVANLRRPKDHDALMQATRFVHDGGRDFHLLFAGDGVRRVALLETCHRLGLEHRVHFLGLRSDIPAILADADVKVFASYWEGLPSSIMEAMAARLPVISTAAGGVPELVQDGITGILVPPGDVNGLALALRQLLDNPPLRQQMGTAGQRRIVTHFRLDEKVAELETVYRSLLQ